ncbi:protein sax-3-like [Ptychodera flava]|uniref:protein sax-3-like n=1 Tax=Ptychodera flava TaxID=63121 RepID=UPI00396A6275
MKISLLLVICLALLACSLAGKRKDKNKKRKKNGKCEQIQTPICYPGNLPYNNTRLPNIMGHSSLEEVDEELANHMALIKTDCSPYANLFICSAYLPECPRKKKLKPLPPCRELCVKAREGCQNTLQTEFGIDWPSELTCDKFPRRDEGSSDKASRRGEESKRKKKKKKNKQSCFYYEPVLPTRMVTPPEILEEPESVTLMVGGIIELKCAAVYEDSLKYSWRKMDGEIPDARNQIDSNEDGSILRILDAEDTDSGTYICKVSNRDGGVVEVSSKVEVQMPPTLSRRPQDARITTGSTARLQCEAHGYPKPTIRWLKDNEMISNPRITARDSMLTIMNAQISDSGIYLCIASNPAGSVNVSAVLEVHEMPRFLETPEDITAAEGGEAEFVCRVDGIPMPTVTWTKGSGDLSSDRVNISMNGTVLRITDVQNSDVDIYTCTAYNKVGAISATAQLEVQVLPRIISIDPARFVAEVGEDTLFECRFSGHPRPTAVWYKQGTEDFMSAGDSLGRFQVTDDGTLIIASVKEDDAGVYICKVENSAGSAEDHGQLEIIPAGTKSVNELPQESVSAMEGEDISLTCTAIGDSQAKVEWSFENTVIKRIDLQSAMNESGQLIIDDVTSSKEGMYKCVASHVWGLRVNLILVTVLGLTTDQMRSTRVSTAIPTLMASEKPTTTMPSSVSDPEMMKENTSDDMTTMMSQAEFSTPMHKQPPTCKPCIGGTDIKKRRYDITDPGLEGYFRGWVDVQGQGAANDFCRVIAAGDSGFQLSCALAGTEGDSQHNYQSTADLDVGFEGTWYMKDEDGDQRDDYCRCVGERDDTYVWCMKAGVDGFYGGDHNDASTGSQYSFKAPGKKRNLKRCEGRIVDPFFGIADD